MPACIPKLVCLRALVGACMLAACSGDAQRTQHDSMDAGPGGGSDATFNQEAGVRGSASGSEAAAGASAHGGSEGTATRGSNAGAGGSRASVAGAGANAAGTRANAAGAGTSAGSAAGSGGTPKLAFQCPPGPFGPPVPSGAAVSRIAGMPPADTFNNNGNTRTNIEGAVWISDKLYVSEFAFTAAPSSRILAVDPAHDNVSVALANTGTNGLAVDAAGDLIATDHKNGALIRMSFPLGTPVVLAGSYDGKRFDSPNDLAVRSDGNIYFSDPDYQAPATKPQTRTRVYRLAPGASTVTVVDENRTQPNGVTLSVDERTLYVSTSDGIYKYPIQADGSISAASGTRLNGYSGSADGLVVDCADNLYATAGKRIAVLSQQGSELASIPVSQAESVTNVAFGGPDHKTLFITSMGTGNQRGVFRVELDVPGMPY